MMTTPGFTPEPVEDQNQQDHINLTAAQEVALLYTRDLTEAAIVMVLINLLLEGVIIPALVRVLQEVQVAPAEVLVLFPEVLAADLQEEVAAVEIDKFKRKQKTALQEISCEVFL